MIVVTALSQLNITVSVSHGSGGGFGAGFGGGFGGGNSGFSTSSSSKQQEVAVVFQMDCCLP